MFARSVILSVLALAMAGGPVLADDDSPAKPTRVLEAGVRGTVLLFDDGCARITLARELIQESSTKIIKESTRKDTVVVRGPNVVGSTVLPSFGGAGGIIQMGEMPIRKDRLERYMAENEQNIAALQSYVDALQIPAEKSATLDPVYVSMRATMDEAQEHLAKLKELASAKRLKNGPIAKEALKIYDAMAKLEKQRGQLLALANTASDQTAKQEETKPAAEESK